LAALAVVLEVFQVEVFQVAVSQAAQQASLAAVFREVFQVDLEAYKLD
jgi:hypothetical protein